MRKSISALVMLPLSPNFFSPRASIASAESIVPMDGTLSSATLPFHRPARNSVSPDAETDSAAGCRRGLADAPCDICRRQDRHVVAMRDAVLLRELSVTEMETDPQRFRGFEQRPGRRSWHFALEETIDLRFVFHPPARKTGQRQFRKD